MSINKYRVPSIERTHSVIRLIADEPGRLKLIDLSKRLEVNKSSMYSLLKTLESLQWINKGAEDTYSLGPVMGEWGSAYFRQFDYVEAFRREAGQAKLVVGETFQLGKLEGMDVLYLAKEEAPTPVRLSSAPGMRFPAHATALGKALLSGLGEQELKELLEGKALAPITAYSVTDPDKLLQQVQQVRENGYAVDIQEAVIGFSCVAAPVYNSQGAVIAAVSCSMPNHVWEKKQELAREHVESTARKISY